jgi:NhaA family Na+:H+ antiporter
MPKKLKNILKTNRLTGIVRFLLKDEAISGKIIIAAMIVALTLTNSPMKWMYDAFWHIELSIGLGSWGISQDLLYWLNDGLMAIFFLVVGLEIKRELVKGELRDRKAAMLPIFAAVGGMVVPAAVYVLFNYGLPTMRGWAIPTATDIALAIGLVTLLGRRVPAALKLFLLTVAIVDDIGSIAVIALFYSDGIKASGAIIAILLVGLIIVLRKWERLHMSLFIILSVALWVAVRDMGVHPSITGALLGFLAPIESMASNQPSLAERLERSLIPVSTLVIIPLFVLGNMGIEFTTASFQVDPNNVFIFWGVLFGLLLGKVVGIVLATWLLVYFKGVKLPGLASWPQLIGVGFLAGVGFTVSTFISNLAFVDPSRVASAKMGVFIASLLCAIIGLLILRFSHSEHHHSTKR